MFRTRDFILIFTVVVFLVVAIGTTVWNQRAAVDNIVDTQVTFVQGEEVETVAYLAETDPLSRSERLAEMRRKISEGEEIFLIDADVELVQEDDTYLAEEELVETNEAVESTVIYCSDYEKFHGLWPVDVRMDVLEEIRIIYWGSENTSTKVASSATELLDFVATQQNTLLELPIRGTSSKGSFCLHSDVVGIANDGSLIRNDEVEIYGIFPAETHIGYALDGFPIYGVGDVSTDQCGGIVVGESYRYYLSGNRETILNCFSDMPIAI